MTAECQRTIKKEVSFSGIGVHTGNKTMITFKPADVDTGVHFIRTDMKEQPVIRASIENVVGVTRGTTIATNGVKIHTVEHVLASLMGFGVDNLIIELDANEPPVGDGSAWSFVEMIKKGGIQEQEAAKNVYAPQAPIWISESDVTLIVLPAEKLRMSFTVSFKHRDLKSQFISTDIDINTFESEIAPSRTFCFYHEVEALMDQGLIKGGSLDNAVVIGDDAIYSKEKLRYKDEFVRHKILDLMGDLYLIGRPLRAHVIAMKSGHTHNIELARKLHAAIQ